MQPVSRTHSTANSRQYTTANAAGVAALRLIADLNDGDCMRFIAFVEF